MYNLRSLKEGKLKIEMWFPFIYSFIFILFYFILFIYFTIFRENISSLSSDRNIDGNYTRMLRAILNSSWRQHPTKQQLYGHLPPITKTIQIRRTRHAGHCWRSTDELISDVLLWTPSHGRAKAGRPVRTYIQQLCEDTGCSPKDLLEAMNDRERWPMARHDIYIYIYIYITFLHSEIFKKVKYLW